MIPGSEAGSSRRRSNAGARHAPVQQIASARGMVPTCTSGIRSGTPARRPIVSGGCTSASPAVRRSASSAKPFARLRPKCVTSGNRHGTPKRGRGYGSGSFNGSGSKVLKVWGRTPAEGATLVSGLLHGLPEATTGQATRRPASAARLHTRAGRGPLTPRPGALLVSRLPLLPAQGCWGRVGEVSKGPPGDGRPSDHRGPSTPWLVWRDYHGGGAASPSRDPLVASRDRNSPPTATHSMAWHAVKEGLSCHVSNE